ncbi:MAG: DUF4907 domain-containing protein [Bacteroidetes bacterium]|nr:DUF4907 domain-containing protein [Bacteroidota bacterium]MBS1930876.1 DUF4907 domain-containing protein [Bacteroidota bacterium]
MRTIIKSNGFILAVAVVISALIFVLRKTKNKTNVTHHFSYKTFDQQSGWGYDILVDEKIFIHQDFIPVIAAEKGFRKKEYAEKAASMIIQKLNLNLLPTLTAIDIRQIGLLDSLVYEQPPGR